MRDIFINRIGRILFVISLVVIGLSASAQSVKNLYVDDDGNQCTVTITGYGLTISYGNQSLVLPVTGINAQGLVYSNGKIGALMDVLGMNMKLFDANTQINFTFKENLSSTVGPQIHTGSTPQSMPQKGNKVCSFCGGRGWYGANSAPVYGNASEYYCHDCQRTVAASHSHDRCPSCGGTGYTY